jgi:hypothetical protein
MVKGQSREDITMTHASATPHPLDPELLQTWHRQALLQRAALEALIRYLA